MDIKEKNIEIFKLIGEITALASIINTSTEATVFINFSGHVQLFEIKIYSYGWDSNKDADVIQGVYIDYEGSLKKLKKAKQRLVKMALEKKIDLTVLPFEIKTIEIKKYYLSEAV